MNKTAIDHPSAAMWRAVALVAAVALAAPALAQQQAQQQTQPAQQQPGPVDQPAQTQTGQRTIDAARVAEQDLVEGWSAERLLDDGEVIGADGENIGSVENLLLNAEGQVVALIAQVGGFWDIGDTHVAVPWNEVQRQGERVRVPVTEENAGDYSLFRETFFTRVDVGDLQTVEDDLETGPAIWKATDLIDDYAVLGTGDGYGYVADLILDQQGKLTAVVVNAAGYGAPGYYAYPWFGYGHPGYAWSPGLDYYTLPYDSTEIAAFETFPYTDIYY